MQPTSTTWRTLWAAGARLEARATIAGTVYTDISAPVIARGLMPDGLSAGNAVSASCALSLRAPGVIPKAAAVVVEQRLTDGTTASEWLPAGTFYISRRSRDPVTGRLSLECYDALLKANAVWEPSEGEWPRPMADVAAELAALIGVSQDPRNAIGALTMAEPAAGTTVRDALCQIAAACGGSWIVTPAGLLRLVPLIVGSRDAVSVRGVLGKMDAGEAAPVTGVRCAAEGSAFLSGDETGAVVTLNSGLPAWAAALQEAWEGATWQRFELSGAIYDPAAELGDALTAGVEGEVDGVLCAETVTLGALPRGDIRAPGPAEVADEYPYIGAAAKALTVAKAYANTVSAAAAQALDNALTQMEIFNRLTGNGAAQGLYLVNGQLYVNASYIQAGNLSASRISGGTLTLGGTNDVNGVIQVLDASGNVLDEVTSEGLSSVSADQQTRALVRAGEFALQTWGISLGREIWRDQLSISANDASTSIAAKRGTLFLGGYGRVTIDNQAGYTDRYYATVSMQDDSLVITLKGLGGDRLLITIARDGGISISQFEPGTTLEHTLTYTLDDGLDITFPTGAIDPDTGQQEIFTLHFGTDFRVTANTRITGNVNVAGDVTADTLCARNGVTTHFYAAGGQTVTVTDGIITGIS